MRNRRTWTVMLVFVMVLTLVLSACSSKENEPAPSNTGGNEQQPAQTGEATGNTNAPGQQWTEFQPIDGKKYTIDWLPYIVNPIPDDAVMVQYYEDLFDVDFNILNLDNQNINELLSLKFASGEIPDFIANGIKINNLPQYVKQGVLMALDEDMIKTIAPDLYEKANQVQPNWLNYAKVDGKIYGLPELAGMDPARYVVIWRGDWLENVGIHKTPETLEEFEEALYKFANEDPDRNGKKDTYGLSLSGLPMIFGAFGYLPGYSPFDWQDWFWHDRDGELVNGAVQPEMKEALRLINKWYNDGVLDPEFITGENMGGYWAVSNTFVKGRIGLTGHGQSYHWMSPLEDGWVGQNYDELNKLDSKAAETLIHGIPPLGPGGRHIYKDNIVNGKILAFGRHLENEPDKLGKILQVLEYTSASTRENNLTAVRGIKGEMWDEIDGVKMPIGEWADKQDRDGGRLIFQQSFGIFPEETPRSRFENAHNYREHGISNKLQISLPSESRYKAELLKMRDEAYISIITGDKPIDYFDEFVQKWNSMGGEQLKNEANEWYNIIKGN